MGVVFVQSVIIQFLIELGDRAEDKCARIAMSH